MLKQLNEEHYIVKSSGGPRYVVGVKTRIDKTKLKVGARVTLDSTLHN